MSVVSLSPTATEAHDDDGLPHTLEHLIFMGSEKYPFKVEMRDIVSSTPYLQLDAITPSSLPSSFLLGCP